MRITTLQTWEKFSKCEENSLYAANKNIFRNWQVGEILVILIGNVGVASMVVSGEPFVSYEMIWENDIYEWRIPVKEIEKYSGRSGEHFNSMLRKFLFSKLGRNYGSLLCNRSKVPDLLEKELNKVVNGYRTKQNC